MDDIIDRRDTSNFGVSRKEVIQVITELRQANLFVKAENHLNYLIRVKWLTHVKMLVRVV